MPRLDESIATPDAPPRMQPFGAWRPRSYVTATPDPRTRADAPLLQQVGLRVGAAQLAELRELLPQVEAAHARALAALEDAERAQAQAAVSGGQADRYAASVQVTDAERNEANAWHLVRRLRDGIEFHQRRDAMASRRERFAAEAGGAPAEAG